MAGLGLDLVDMGHNLNEVRRLATCVPRKAELASTNRKELAESNEELALYVPGAPGSKCRCKVSMVAMLGMGFSHRRTADLAQQHSICTAWAITSVFIQHVGLTTV